MSEQVYKYQHVTRQWSGLHLLLMLMNFLAVLAPSLPMLMFMVLVWTCDWLCEMLLFLDLILVLYGSMPTSRTGISDLFSIRSFFQASWSLKLVLVLL